MPKIQSSEELLAKLTAAAKHKMSPEEARAQKVSFILSSSGGGQGITRERIEEVLDRQECR